jgi:catalase
MAPVEAPVPKALAATGHRGVTAWMRITTSSRASFRKMNPQENNGSLKNTARAINGASQEVLLRHIENCRRADPAYGEGVAKVIDISISELVSAK